MRLKSWVFVATCILSLTISLYSAETKAPVRIEGYDPDVPNLMQVRDKVYTGGQPTTEGMRSLDHLGVKLVINLRPHEEPGARDESIEAEAYGMKYVNIPLTPKTFTQEKIQQLQQLISDEKNYPVYIHCKSGNRAGAAWLAYRVQYEGAKVPEALEEGKAIGMVPELEPVVLKLIEESGE